MTLTLESPLEEESLVMSTWRERREYVTFCSFLFALSISCMLPLFAEQVLVVLLLLSMFLAQSCDDLTLDFCIMVVVFVGRSGRGGRGELRR